MIRIYVYNVIIVISCIPIQQQDPYVSRYVLQDITAMPPNAQNANIPASNAHLPQTAQNAQQPTSN